MKKYLIGLIFILISALPVKADIVWPSLYIAKGMLSLKVIVLGLIIELLFVKYFMKICWKKALIITFLMNLITTVLGIILIPVSGLGYSLIIDFIFHAYDKFGIGTFHWSNWFASYLLVVILNTLIEGTVIKLSLNQNLKQNFWWLFIANAISVIICFCFMI